MTSVGTVCHRAHWLGGKRCTDPLLTPPGILDEAIRPELRTSSRPTRMSRTDRRRPVVGSRAVIRLGRGQDWPAVRPVIAKTALGWEE